MAGASPPAPAQDTYRSRLFRKYLLLILSLVTTVLLISSGINLYFSYRENRAALSNLQHEKAIGAASRIEQYIRQVSQQLAYASLPQLDAGDVQARRIEFLKLLRQAPEVTDIAQLDAAGREQLAVSRLGMDVVASNRDRSAEPAFQQARRGQPWYGPVYFRKETEPYMTVAIRSGADALGKRGPVTVAEVNLKFIWDVVSRIKIGTQGKAYVVDANGLLVADPDIGLVLRKTSLAALAHVKAAAHAQDADAPAMVSRDLLGTPVLTSTAAIEPLGWNVFVEQPIAEVYAKLDASILRTGLLLLAGLVISALAASTLARSMVRPIRTLDEGARHIGEGNLDQRIVVQTGDELEGLADQFNRMTAQLRESYAGLERKVEARTAELSESLEYQTATAEILKVISNSPTDVQPVLDAVAERSRLLCRADGSRVWLLNGDHLRAVTGYRLEDGSKSGRDEVLPLRRSSVVGRAFVDHRTVHVEDVARLIESEYPDSRAIQARHGFRTVLAVPMLREGASVGIIAVLRKQVHPFSRAEIRLVETFADQALIAIENVRLFNETKEALEQQTATAEVLQVISGSMADARPVFDKILQSCQRLFAAAQMGITLVGADGRLHFGAHLGSARERLEKMYPRPIDGSPVGMRMAGHAVVHLPDVLGTPGVPQAMREIAEQVGNYAIMVAPMLWEGRNIGSIHVTRQPPAAFADKEMALLKTFADQAVIAIQNARLFTETKEALEQQTAIAEILRVISSSPTNTQPVFDAIVKACQRLFEGQAVAFCVPRDGMIETAAFFDDGTRGQREGGFLKPWPLDRESAAGACLIDARVINVVDTEIAVREFPRMKNLALALGYRSGLFVPLLRDRQAIGVIAILRATPGAFTDPETELARTFADQAVIAIENVRLLNETKEALEQQTATAEILQVISGSVADAQPVFDKIVESCHRLFASDMIGIQVVGDDAILRLAAYVGVRRDQLESLYPMPLEGSSAALAIRERRVVHTPDVLNGAQVAPTLLRTAQFMGRNFSHLQAPMLWDGKGIGSIFLTRMPPMPFSDSEIDLLKTFADQAVIAIQNARLFHEIEDKSRQLEVANRHKSEFLANMSHELRTPLNAIIGFSEVLTEQMFGDVNAKQMEYLQDIHSSGQHLLTLINDVLDLSKIEAGRMELDLSCFDLGLLLDNSLTLVRERAQRHGLTVALEVGEGLNEWVADARKVKQVVVNLLSNAVKFTPTGGRVTVRARHADVADRQMAEISVTDTGVGIAPEERALVFEEFRQASGDYLRKTEGTGLGLSLAKRFVELHGGTIRIDSERGHGATFTVTLPGRVVAKA